MPSTTPEVDLDALAAGYRHRPASPAALDRARRAVSGIDEGDWALDVGGGPGVHAGQWRGLRAVVLDPGREMVHLAAARPGVTAIVGTSQRMPFRSKVFALVYFHLSIHYGDWRGALAEALRVVRPAGRVDIWTLGPDHHSSSMLARWFPRVAEIDSARFPDPADLVTHLEGLGVDVAHERVDEVRRRSVADWEDAVRAGFVSTLQFLDAGELGQGLDAFRRTHPDPSEVVVYRLRFDHLTVTT